MGCVASPSRRAYKVGEGISKRGSRGFLLSSCLCWAAGREVGTRDELGEARERDSGE